MVSDVIESEQPSQCDACGWPTAALKSYDTMNFSALRGKPMWLCALCANTKCGNAHQYPDQYGGQLPIMSVVCYVGNAILDALKERTT